MQLKHLFVFLLFLVLSVAESPVYSQNKTSDYYQSSKLIDKKKFSYVNTKFVVYKQNIVSYRYFLYFFFPKLDISTEFQKQIQTIFKLQKNLQQEIAWLNLKYTFLIHQNTSSNSIPTLYIV